jgi:site-specific recombinase XerD
MLHRVIQDFLSYCRLADFSHRSLQALAIRLSEFTEFIKSQHIRSIKKINYLNLLAFVADFNSPSVSVLKSLIMRDWYNFIGALNVSEYSRSGRCAFCHGRCLPSLIYQIQNIMQI